VATYDELLNLQNDVGLNNKIRFAVIVAAETIRTEAPATAKHAERLAWARDVFQNPSGAAITMRWAVLAQNRAQTVAQIQGATDAQVQTAVDAAVSAFAL